MPIKIFRLREAREETLGVRWPNTRGLNEDLLNYVEAIIRDVRKRGDSALVDLTAKFDGVKLSPEHLRVSKKVIEEAYSKVGEEEISAIKLMKDRVERLERSILTRVLFEYKDEDHVEIRREYRPIRSVGCYIPGGKAAYPSTVAMTVVPAKVAGVSRIAVCSPPRSNGEVNPLTLVAADICGADEVYMVGGVQAIAALAYGTETIKPVEKIVGPGNQYVLAAKSIVSRDVPIDFPAGPSEIMVLADETADPGFIAWDMVSQAEHGSDSVSILVTTSMRVAESVLENIRHIIEYAPNRDTVAQALGRNGLILVSESMCEAIEFINDFAPEHLEIIVENAREISGKINSAGLILVGGYTPVSLSDYCLGTNHVLPTRGFSHIHSSLSVFNFIRFVNVAECSRETLKRLWVNVKVLAKGEGLLNHALAVEERLKD